MIFTSIVHSKPKLNRESKTKKSTYIKPVNQKHSSFKYFNNAPARFHQNILATSEEYSDQCTTRKQFILNADHKLPYEKVIQLLGRLRDIGGDRVSLAIDN